MVNETIICTSPEILPKGAPSIVRVVALIAASSSGSSNGKESTGYKVALVFAFEINAAMIVKTEESPRLPKVTISENRPVFLISSPVIIM